MDKSCSPAAGFVNSVTILEKTSRNEADGKFNHDVSNADSTEEFINWSGEFNFCTLPTIIIVVGVLHWLDIHLKLSF